METRLTVELVPSTCWYTNVRSNVSKAVWDRLRRRVAAEAGQRCEVCGGRGRRWPVECHEVWAYDDATKVQRLERLVALCPACHEVKHAGLASKRGRLGAVIDHLARLNGWTAADAALYLEAAFEQWAARSRHRWTLDISVLADRYGVDRAHGWAMPGHVVLVGLMGSGKTTVGRELAILLNCPLVDNDEQVLAMTGLTVAEISAHAGVAEMRRLEGEALAQALASPVPAVITAAAGVILDDRAPLWLREPFVVWLRAETATLAARVARGPARPLLGDDPEAVLRAMEQQRHRLYAEVADCAVDVDRLAPADVAAAIAARFRDFPSGRVSPPG